MSCARQSPRSCHTPGLPRSRARQISATRVKFGHPDQWGRVPAGRLEASPLESIVHDPVHCRFAHRLAWLTGKYVNLIRREFGEPIHQGAVCIRPRPVSRLLHRFWSERHATRRCGNFFVIKRASMKRWPVLRSAQKKRAETYEASSSSGTALLHRPPMANDLRLLSIALWDDATDFPIPLAIGTSWVYPRQSREGRSASPRSDLQRPASHDHQAPYRAPYASKALPRVPCPQTTDDHAFSRAICGRCCSSFA